MFRCLKPIHASLISLVLAGCGSRLEPTDTSTSWLATCESSSECSSSFSCICGVCTLECNKDSQCASASESAVCRAPDDECSAAASLCLKEPSTDTTSSSLDGGDSTLESADASDTDNLTFPTTETTDLAAPTSSDTDSAGNDTLYPNDGSAPLPPAEICDGSDDIRFLYLADSTGFADRREVFYNTHGGHLLAIDGKCHFRASRGGGLLLEGDLAAPALASLQQTHYGRLGTYPKESAQCLDAPSKILWDPYGSTVCWCNCESEEEPGRTAAFSFAPTLLGELFATGTPTTGDLRLLLLTRSSTDEIEGQVAWPLTFEQSDIAQAPEEVEWFTDQGTLFPAGMDAQRLRLARAEFEDLTGGSTPVHFEYSAPDAGADGAVLSTGYLRDEPPSKVVAALETARAENPWPEL